MSDKECKRFAGERYLTVVFKDVSRDEAYELIHHHKMSACSWSHALDDRDKARASLPVGVPDGYIPIPTAEQLADALDGVRCYHDMSAELIAPELLANLLAVTTVKESLSVAPSLPAAGSAREEVEVVAWQDAENPLYTTAERRVMHEWVANQYPIVELMTVAQHERIVAAMQQDLDYFPPTVRALTETIAELRAALSSQQSAQPEFCCEHSYKVAKQAAWGARDLTQCKCDHNEYCEHCWPDDFREGGKWHNGSASGGQDE